MSTDFVIPAVDHRRQRLLAMLIERGLWDERTHREYRTNDDVYHAVVRVVLDMLQQIEANDVGYKVSGWVKSEFAKEMERA